MRACKKCTRCRVFLALISSIAVCNPPQMYASMVKSGLRPSDLMEMKAATHEEDIVAFLNSVMAGGQMDQLQTPYAYDMVLHSVMPVPEHIATANLKPLPGVIEYAPECHDCHYKMHRIYSTTENKFYDQWYRCGCCTHSCALLHRLCAHLMLIRTLSNGAGTTCP